MSSMIKVMKLFEVSKKGKRMIEVECNGWAIFWTVVMLSIIFG